ncbi:MAG: YncE family protein [Kofleriaceae bacterium]
MRTAAALGCALVCACTASAEDVRPLENQLFFPTGAAVAPGGSTLFVTNANSDLTFDSGSVSVISLEQVDTIVDGWLLRGEQPAGCSQDADYTETLTCEEAVFLDETRGSGVRIGNFATEIAVQDLGNGNLRLVIPTRGDPSITWVDWAGSQLSCNASGEQFSLCDDTHRLSFVFNDADLSSIPDEPFGVFADSAGEFAVVTHLVTGSVSLIDSPRTGDAIVTDVVSGIFAADQSTGVRGATGVAGRTPDAAGDIIYVGSRTEDRIQTFTVGRPVNNAPPFLLQGNWFFLDSVGGDPTLPSTDTGGSRDTRGMAFSATGDRLYLVNRAPPSLQVIDTSLGPTGFPRNVGVGAADICRQASTITVADSGDGERIYVTCFQDGQIYVLDPRGRVTVDDIITVGRGPYSVVASPARKKLYVTNFLEDTVAVIDLNPSSPRHNRVVLRIGVPRPL